MDNYQAKMIKGITTRQSLTPISIYSSKGKNYPELHLFKHQIEIEPHDPKDKPYTATKPRVYLYRTIFWTIGAIYMILAFIISYKSLSWTYSILFAGGSITKTMLSILCFTSSFTSIILGFLIRIEREAVRKLYQDAKHNLWKIYDKKMTQHDVKRLFAFGDDYKKSKAFKQLYHDTLDRLNERKEQTLALIDRISGSKTLDSKTKEVLYNQAILELSDKVDLAIDTYKTAVPFGITLNRGLKP